MRLASTLRAVHGRLALVVLAGALALVVAACGGGDDESAATTEAPAATTEAPPATTEAATTEAATTEAPAETTAPAETEAPTEEVVTDYLAYVGGTAGPADSSLSPIAIGWINQQDGTQTPFPEATAGAQAAVDYVNEELGGVAGHPLELHTCILKNTEEEGVQCGQEMANDDDVNVVLFGAVTFGAESLLAQLQGSKPVVVGVGANPVLNNAENVYQLYGSDLSILAPWGTFASEVLGATTAALIYDDVPGGNTGAEAMREGLEAAGVEVTAVGIPLNSPDLLGPITAAGGQDADVIIPNMGPTGCINLAKALDQIGSDTPVVSNPLCLIGPVAEALGDTPQWYYGIAQALPADPNAPDSVVYIETSGKYGLPPEQAYGPFAALGWGTVLELVKLMNEIGPDNLTPESIGAAVQAFTGPLVMGAPDVQCGLYPPTPSACSNQTKFYDYEGMGVFVSASDWLRPPGE